MPKFKLNDEYSGTNVGAGSGAGSKNQSAGSKGGSSSELSSQASADAITKIEELNNLLLGNTFAKTEPALDPSIQISENAKLYGKTSIIDPGPTNLIFGTDEDWNAIGTTDGTTARETLDKTHQDFVRNAIGKIWTTEAIDAGEMSRGGLIFIDQAAVNGNIDTDWSTWNHYAFHKNDKFHYIDLPLAQKHVGISTQLVPFSSTQAPWVESKEMGAWTEEELRIQVGISSDWQNTSPSPVDVDYLVDLALQIWSTPQGQTESFYDYVTEYGSPFSLKDSLENTKPNPLYYDYRSRYNYYEQEYEKYASDDNKELANFLEMPHEEGLYPDINTAIMEESVKNMTISDALELTFTSEEGDWPADHYVEKSSVEDVDTLKKFAGTFMSGDFAAAMRRYWTSFHNFVTLFNRIKDVFVDVLKEGIPVQGEKHAQMKTGEKSKGNYYRKWATTIRRAIRDNMKSDKKALQELRIKHRNVVFTPFSIDAINKREEAKFLFPMYNEIEFATDTKTELADSISHTEEFDRMDPKSYYFFIKAILEGMESGDHKEGLSFNNNASAGMLSTAALDKELVAKGQQEVNRTELLDLNSFVLYEDNYGAGNFPNTYHDKFMNNKLNPNENFTENANKRHILLDDPQLGIGEASRSNPNLGDNSLIMTLMNINLKKKIKSMAGHTLIKILGKPRGKTRRYKDIIDGKLAYSETLFYRIAKHRVVNGKMKSEPMQNYYFPNTSKIDVLKFVDTQIKYNREYVYKVYSWQAIFGTKYKYELSDVHKKDRFKNEFKDYVEELTDEDWIRQSITSIKSLFLKVFTIPSIMVVELPYIEGGFNFDIKTKAIDYSPLPPEIKFIPFKGVDDKILINLNSSVGEIKVFPPYIGDTPDNPEGFDIADIIGTYASSIHQDYAYQYSKPVELGGGEIFDQGPDVAYDSNLPIIYRTDDFPDSFYYLRLDDKPSTYADFKNAKVDELVVGNATSYSLIDDVVPNKKYYYSFMTKDVHNGVSTPSPVYEVEMVEQEGMIYPLINVIELSTETSPGLTSKPGKKYIHIMPTLEQSLLNEETSLPPYNQRDESDDVDQHFAAKGATPQLGISEEHVFNDKKYKFKIRLVSKKTGKKIDLNVAFDSEHIVTEKEQNYDKYHDDSWMLG